MNPTQWVRPLVITALILALISMVGIPVSFPLLALSVALLCVAALLA